MIGKRLAIRSTTIDDIQLLKKWYKQEDLMKHIGFDNGLYVTDEELNDRITHQKNNEKLLMITLLDGTPIGECHYYDISNSSCKVGIKIADISYQGKGYGKEGLQMLLAHLFGVLGIRIVFADVLEENERARNLFKSIGFDETAIKTNAWTDPNGNQRNAALMTVTIDAFKSALNIPFKMV